MPPNAADASLTLAPFATEGFRAGGSASRFAAARAATRAGRTATYVDDEGACRWSAARARRSFRACGASARARDAWRRSHWTCQSGGCTVRRLVRCGGVGETGADALPRAGRRVGRRARSTHSSPWSWCVRFTRRSSSYGAAADEPGELGWACERQRQIPNEPFSHVLFSVSLTCRIAPIARILRGSHWPRR